MLLSEVQQYNFKKTGCQCCLSIVSSVDERLSVASTTISRQYAQCKRRKRKSIKNSWNSIAIEKSEINCSKHSCCKLLTTDKMSFYLDEEVKHQAKDQFIQDRTFFLSSINQSFSIFHDNYLNVSSKTPSISCTSKSNQLRKNFKSSRFKSIQKAIFFIILFVINCALANENLFANSVNSIESQRTNRLRELISPMLSSNSTSNLTALKLINSSISYSSLSFIENLLPSTKSFNSFYSNNQPENDQSTTRLPIIKNFNSSQPRSVNHNLIETNQTKSAHLIKNAFQINFNQLNADLSNDKFIVDSEKWPYASKVDNFQKTSNKFNWTDRFKKAIVNTDWTSSASTESAKFTNKYYSNSDFSSSDYDSNISQFLNSIPTPSALINQLSNQTSSLNNKTISNAKNLDSKTVNETNQIKNLNFTDSSDSFTSGFLQPFINISWWNKIPFPQSGYHNYSIVFLAFFITIVMMVVVIGNLLVCIAICTEKSLKTIQNWFIASLAVSDLLLGLIIMPFSLAYELMGTWVFSDLWCDIHHALDVLLTTASINNLCLISLDRYWSVTQAIEYLKKRTPCRAIFMIVFAWVFSALVSLPPLIGWKKENEAPGECTLSNDFGYVLYSSLGSFYIPSVVMVFVYARIFVAARSRARKHVRKKQVSGGSSVLEQKKTPSLISKPVPSQASSSSQNNTTAFKQPITISASSTVQQGDYKKEDSSIVDSNLIQKSESKGSIKAQTNRLTHGRFTIKSQLGTNDQQELEESETDVNQGNQSSECRAQEQPTATNLHTVSIQTTNTESGSSGIGTAEEIQINSVPTSGSSVQTEPASTDAKSSNFVCARSTSAAFTYDHLFVEDRKSAPAGQSSDKSESIGRPATPSSKVTFSPNNIVFDLHANGTQSVSMVPQIVIHGSMQQLHLQTNVKRTRFSVNKMKDSDFNNNTNQSNEKRFGHPTITGTLSAGQLDCVILDQSRDQSDLKDIATGLTDSGQPKRSSIKRTKYQNELEIDCTIAQQLNQQQNVGSPHSILKPTSSSNTSPTALNKNEQQIELQEKLPTIASAQHQTIKKIESNLATASSTINKDDKTKVTSVSNHVSPVSKTFSEQTANSVKLTQDGKLNYLGVSSLQSAASISGSMMSINYDYDSECYMDEKSSRRGFEDEFEFDEDENESSNTHDENASKRSVKSNLRHSKKGNIFNRWSWCKKWLWLNEKCAANQEEEFAGYEEDDEEEDEEFDQMGSSLRSTTGEHSAKKGTGKRILRKNRNKNYNASIISANNTSSSGTHCSGTAQQQTERKLGEKKSNSLFSRFSRDNSNKSTSSGSAKRNATPAGTATAKQQRASAKSSCSVSAISQSSQTGRHRKHRHKSGQLHAHSSSTTAQSDSGAASQYRFQQSDADRQRRRIAKAREKRATLILGLIMGAFILGYIPFSSMYLVQGICPQCQIQSALTITYWIGYTASAINPIIYTVFNRDFRKAFRKILFR